MPALSPEQRRRQIEMQRAEQRRRLEANKPKSGQKGATTSGGSSTKSETIGGSKPKPVKKTKPTRAPSGDWRSKVGNTDVNALRAQQEAERLKNQQKADKEAASRTKPAPVPRPAAKQGSGSSSTQSSRPAATQSSPSKPATPSSESYRDGGKGLYQGSKEYRDKVGGSGNPLLNRFRQDMGRDSATGEKGNSNYSKPEDKSKYVAPDGRPYQGPGYGNGSSGSEKLQKAMDEMKKKREEDRKRAEKLRASRSGTAFGGVN